MAEGEQIEKQLQLFLDLINQSDDGIFVVDPDSSLILYCNDKARNRLGYAPEELLAMGVVDIEEIMPAIFSWHEHVKEVRKKGHYHRRQASPKGRLDVSCGGERQVRECWWKGFHDRHMPRCH